MPQIIIITQNYIRLFFLAGLNGIFCIKIKSFKKIENWLLHLASTNLLSLTQNKRFLMGLK